MATIMWWQPGCPCCCDCFFDSSFAITTWQTLAGTWTSGYRTESQYAIRISPRVASPLQMLMVLVSGGTIPQTTYASNVRSGFRNNDGDQIYVERTWTGTNWQEIVYEQMSGGSPVVVNAGIIYPYTGQGWGPLLLLDNDYSRLSVWSYYQASSSSCNQYRGVYKCDTTKAYNRAFIGTGALTAGEYASFGLRAHYNCLCRYCTKKTDVIPIEESKGGIDLGPSEFELMISDAGNYADAGWDTYIDCQVVAYYEREIASAITFYKPPFTVPDWLCIWFSSETRTPGCLHRFVWIEYGTVLDGYTSVYVTVSVNATPLNVSPSGGRYATWRRDIEGKIDARTLSLTGSSALTSADLIATTFPAGTAEDKVIEVVASP